MKNVDLRKKNHTKRFLLALSSQFLFRSKIVHLLEHFLNMSCNFMMFAYECFLLQEIRIYRKLENWIDSRLTFDRVKKYYLRPEQLFHLMFASVLKHFLRATKLCLQTWNSPEFPRTVEFPMSCNQVRTSQMCIFCPFRAVFLAKKSHSYCAFC